MAKGKGIVQLTGTLQGFTFYLLDGKQVVRTAGGGFNGEAIKTKASMARVRENSSEFKNCMQTVASFKQMLQPYLQLLKDGKLHQRLVRVFTQLKAFDITSTRGQRIVAKGLATAHGRDLLRGYVLTQDGSLQSMLQQAYIFDEQNGLQVPHFNTTPLFTNTIADQMELFLRYILIDANGEFSFVQSEKLVIDHNFSGDVALAVPILPDYNCCVVVAIGRFFQEINGNFYPLSKGVMEVVEVMG
ncbi:conserved hypothetical protein [Flavobacterium sp. 9AF]|uniref:hypothetical protein n=1 Tax=Flavobacterium sp. 9AF TaxID=2653142 RepID=UPI0012F1C455|nr:hypothetical protein [Flavobacterium sp. 9AF]VXA91586.1 conserved hypothetical protein [Flavobacterium sp. 9AF]